MSNVTELPGIPGLNACIEYNVFGIPLAFFWLNNAPFHEVLGVEAVGYDADELKKLKWLIDGLIADMQGMENDATE